MMGMARTNTKIFSDKLQALKNCSIAVGDQRYCCISRTWITALRKDDIGLNRSPVRLMPLYYDVMDRSEILGDTITAGQFESRYGIGLPVSSHVQMRKINWNQLTKAEYLSLQQGQYMDPDKFVEDMTRR